MALGNIPKYFSTIEFKGKINAPTLYYPKILDLMSTCFNRSFPTSFFFFSGCRFSANDVHLFEGISSLTKLFFRLNFPPTLFALMSFVFTYLFIFGHTRYIRQNYFFSDFNFQTHFFLVLFSTF